LINWKEKYSGQTLVSPFKIRVSGVDVMIIIFGDFRQFSAKKMAFFSQTNVMINFLHNLALHSFVLSQKRQFSAKNWRFSQNQC
jgi:hypothetical protein